MNAAKCGEALIPGTGSDALPPPTRHPPSLSQAWCRGRAENGTRLLARPVVQAWLKATSAKPDVRQRVLALTETAHVKQTWADQLADDRHLQDQERARDAAAAVVRSFHPTVLPGLLQTADYARHVIPLADISGRVDHAAALAARIVGQAVLREPGRRFDFLIAEHVLSWEPAPGIRDPALRSRRRRGALQ